ncbi:MAG: alanine--tRNA ligase, partial [Candidatus Zambryskibacteria bacterium CG22_combo_CG10-13_8_21_14_all_42_17]
MQSREIRQKFLKFFEQRGHVIIPSVSLVPENDPTVLFTTAGMQPLVPYLLGREHPRGRRLVNIQKCVRTQDIEEVGDNTHDTFFEMLGNWSLGDYFKEDAIKWSFELLTSKEEGFGLDPDRLYITVFEGDLNAPRDDEAYEIWKKYMPTNRIFFMGAKSNWWSVGDNGPCGPDTEMFYDITSEGLGDLTKEEYEKADDEQKVVEVWNDVFMEYEKKDGKITNKLPQKNVDTGAGLERLAMALQNKNNIFETDLFEPIILSIQKNSDIANTRHERIVADHIRTSVFLISDGVLPTNTDRGYILRRLLRRAYVHVKKLGGDLKTIGFVADTIINHESYKNIYTFSSETGKIMSTEIEKFDKTLESGLKQFEKGIDPFILFTTYGFPFELTEELANEKNIKLDKNEFQKKFLEHQRASRAGAEQKFKGGLAGHSYTEVKYHTATHLLHYALREVLGKEVLQRGSNITPKRLRFDFSFARKMTDEEKKTVEYLVNNKINESLPVSYQDISLEEAKNLGAIGLFEEKYGDKVRVYNIGNFSLEFCGGPHVESTSELARGRDPEDNPRDMKFKIIKEE